jgi:ribosomal protein L35
MPKVKTASGKVKKFSYTKSGKAAASRAKAAASKSKRRK